MIEFDLSRFRDLAFGRQAVSDHPLHDESAVERFVAELPGDALAGLAELTHWVLSVNSDDTFAPEKRGRVLMALDAAVRPFWSELSIQYLEPHGRPAEGQDGQAGLLRAMAESAAAFATGFGFCIEITARPSRWSEQNLAHLALRRARWLGRRFTLMNMQLLPAVGDLWEELHALYQLADKRAVLKKVVRVYPGQNHTSSVKQEYTRLMLLDLSGLDALRGREIELAFRIAGRVAPNARLEPEPIPGAICAIEVSGSSRPTAVRRLQGSREQVLYLDAFNCLPRLKAMLERDMDRDLSEPDTMFGAGFTLRERNAMIHRLIDLWGPTPPQRRSKRVPFNSAALMRGGFESVIEVIPPFDQGDLGQPDPAPDPKRIRIVLDAPVRVKPPETLKKSLAATEVRLVDASVGGMGLAVPAKSGRWAVLGMLVAIYVEPGPEWVVGVIKRISAQGDSIGLGILVLTRQAKLAWFRLETTGYASVWDEEQRHERNFLEFFQRGILLEADRAPLGPGEIVIAPGIADRGTRLELPLAHGTQRIRVTAVREAAADFHRVAFESLGVTNGP